MVTCCQCQHFFYKPTHTSRTSRARAPQESAFDSSFNGLTVVGNISYLTRGQRFSLQRTKTLNILVLCSFSITFYSRKAGYLFCWNRVPLAETRGMKYQFTLKGHLENLTKGHDLTSKGHVAYQSIRIVGLNPSQVFSSL